MIGVRFFDAPRTKPFPKKHDDGEDCTELIKKYEAQIIKSGPAELQGCVVVTEELAGILQQLMDKYTFEGVETSWRKMCYYYEKLG